MHDDELDRFKRDINLVEFATARFGYRRRPRESSRSSHVLHRAADHDKILVARETDGHWVYCSVRDDRDNGTVIDFLQRRQRLDLGRIRQELRDWLHTPRPDPGPACRPDSPPLVRDRHQVVLAFAAASRAQNSAYLNERGIRPATLQDPSFAASWKIDRRGNVLFPHRDDEGLSGFEIKNAGFTGFASGGRKALWQSVKRDRESTLVLCESAIDALSYQQMHRLQNARYLSTAGSLSSDQRDQLARLFGRTSPKTLVVAAVDTDLGGNVLAAQLQQLAKAHARAFVRHSPDPAIGKDWNDVVKRVERDFIRSLSCEYRLEKAR
jgi:hypothetical protein